MSDRIFGAMELNADFIKMLLTCGNSLSPRQKGHHLCCLGVAGVCGFRVTCNSFQMSRNEMLPGMENVIPRPLKSTSPQ